MLIVVCSNKTGIVIVSRYENKQFLGRLSKEHTSTECQKTEELSTKKLS